MDPPQFSQCLSIYKHWLRNSISIYLGLYYAILHPGWRTDTLHALKTELCARTWGLYYAILHPAVMVRRSISSPKHSFRRFSLIWAPSHHLLDGRASQPSLWRQLVPYTRVSSAWWDRSRCRRSQHPSLHPPIRCLCPRGKGSLSQRS